MAEKLSPCGIKCSKILNTVKPYLAMVSLQFGYAGMYVITMVSLKKGMNHYILAVYRHGIATLIMAPFALVLERKSRPKMTFSVFWKISLLGFLEPVLDQNLYYVGMTYTSATFAAATVNVLPAITLILAVTFRLERINIKKISSLAKVMGTIITVVGAVVMTLYKGPIVDIFTSGGSHHRTTTVIHKSGDGQHWVAGTLMLLTRCVGWSAFFILQTFTLEEYPSQLTVTTLVCLMGTLKGTAVSLAMVRDMSSWIIGWDSRLLAAAYSGIVCSGVAYFVQGVVIRERGPVFVTSFSPLCMIITAGLGAIILAEQFHLGSIIGNILIVFGLYAVMWGKSKDQIKNKASSFTEDEEIGNHHELPITNIEISVNVNGQSEEINKIIQKENQQS